MSEPLTRAKAEALGWTFDLDRDDSDPHLPIAVALPSATNGTAAIAVSSDTPLFTLLALVAEREGVPFAEGYGGTQKVTPSLVKRVSGEDYTPPAADPEPQKPTTFADVAAELAKLDAKKHPDLAGVIAAAKAATKADE